MFRIVRNKTADRVRHGIQERKALARQASEAPDEPVNPREDLRDLLGALPANWQPRATGLREGVKSMFEEKRKRAALWTWIGTGVGFGLMLLGVPALLFGCLTGNASVAVAGAMMFLFGDGWMTGRKLLYWTWLTRIQIERDVKEVHYDVLDVLKRLERVEAAMGGKTGQAAS